jgi:general L-amino acid transport system substrate-binding protein
MNTPARFRWLLASMAAIATLAAAPAHAGKTLDGIKQRGAVACGVHTGRAGFALADGSGNWSGLDADFCRAVAAATLGDPGKVKFVPTSSQTRITALQSGEIDLLARNTTWTFTRDSGLGLLWAGVNFHDGQGFVARKKPGLNSVRQLSGATICVISGSTTEKTLSEYFRAHKLNYKGVVFDNPDDYVILPEVISKEPAGPAVRRGDDEWFAIVRWTLNAMIEAEELGITQANADDLKARSDSIQVKRFLGQADDLGKQLGLDKEWALRIVKAVGNYGESYERNLGARSGLNVPRGKNALATKGGLMMSPPMN